MFIKFLVILLFSLTSSYAKNNTQFLEITVTLEKDQSLAVLYSRFVKEDSIIKKSSPMNIKTLESNKHIKNWRKIKKNSEVTLFLNKAFIDEKKLAAYKNTQITKKNKIQKKHVKIDISIGSINITDEDKNDLAFKYLKLGTNYQNKFSEKYDYIIGLSTVKFFELDYSQTDEIVDYDKFLPEVNLGVLKKIKEKLSIYIGYDYLNYFVLSDVALNEFKIEPGEIHRLRITSTYSFNSRFKLTPSIGYLQGAGTGLDGSMVLSMKTHKNDIYQKTVNIIGYYSSLETKNKKESSNAVAMSFSFSL